MNQSTVFTHAVVGTYSFDKEISVAPFTNEEAAVKYLRGIFASEMANDKEMGNKNAGTITADGTYANIINFPRCGGEEEVSEWRVTSNVAIHAAEDATLEAIRAKYRDTPAKLREACTLRLTEIRATLENNEYDDAEEEAKLIAEECELGQFLCGGLYFGDAFKLAGAPPEIIHVTESNVDGCGGAATMSIVIRDCVDVGIRSKLENALQETKSSDEWLCTEDMITHACDIVFGVGKWAYLGQLIPISDIKF